MQLTAVASRAGVHHSAVRRYFTSHKEVLLRLAAEGWVRWSNAVCEQLAAWADVANAVAETFADGLRPTRCFVTCSPTCTSILSTRWMSTR